MQRRAELSKGGKYGKRGLVEQACPGLGLQDSVRDRCGRGLNVHKWRSSDGP